MLTLFISVYPARPLVALSFPIFPRKLIWTGGPSRYWEAGQIGAETQYLKIEELGNRTEPIVD